MERCEKLTAAAAADNIETKKRANDIADMDSVYLPCVDREGKTLGDLDYMVPSPPERDINIKLSPKELEDYARTYPSTNYQISLTQADLEEYTRSYDEALTHHQKQPSYAQSEGYHSYVSSTDSMSTPFLDRLRRDSEARNPNTSLSLPRDDSNRWDDLPERENDPNRREGRDSVVTTSSGSGASSSETLKWHGSMSDVSVASSSCTHNSPSSKQLIAHSARVQTPQRHNSESVLYIGVPGGEQPQGNGWKEREIRNNQQNKLRLFPVNTYTVQPDKPQNVQSSVTPQPIHHR